ncbi:MAG: helical backbone metal receptor [Propioniciclava sp.]|uniref:helical backbone metal receptor n=1 Tax=Propioniciclava sp. TaxID=2038686 RepID=UPI0039E410B3
MFDDLGVPVEVRTSPRRVVSLVPSLTEAIAATVPGVLVGATDWCTHPDGLDVERVRGTKNPDRAKIAALKPDLVIANEEENRKLDVERLRDAGITVWVTKIDSVDEAFRSLERLFRDAFGLTALPHWLHQARDVWDAPPRRPGLRVAVPIWRDPWIWVGAHTYAGDVMERLGWTNAAASLGERYPHADPARTVAASGGMDAVLLPDEPYAFGPDDGPDAFPATLRTVAVPGRALFWYGPAMIEARETLEASIN